MKRLFTSTVRLSSLAILLALVLWYGYLVFIGGVKDRLVLHCPTRIVLTSRGTYDVERRYSFGWMPEEREIHATQKLAVWYQICGHVILKDGVKLSGLS